MQITFQMIVKHFLLQHNSFTMAFWMIKTSLMQTLETGIVSTPINSDQEISISEQIDDSSDISEESFVERVCMWSVAHSVFWNFK